MDEPEPPDFDPPECPQCDRTIADGGDRCRECEATGNKPDGRPRSATESPLRTVGVAVGLAVLGLILLVAVGLASAVGLFLVVWLATGDLPSEFSVLVVSTAVGQYVGFLGLGLAYLRYRGFDRARITDYLGVRWPTLREVGLIVVGYVAIIVVVIVWAGLIDTLVATEPADNEGAETIAAAENPWVLPAAIALMFLVVGPCEEVLYRGVVQNRLRERLSAVPSIFIASAVFAAVHVVAFAAEPMAVLVAIGILLGPSVVFGAIYEYTQNIVVPSLLHGLHNSIIVVLILAGPDPDGNGAVIAPLTSILPV